MQDGVPRRDSAATNYVQWGIYTVRLSAHVHTVRRIAWSVAGVAWCAFFAYWAYHEWGPSHFAGVDIYRGLTLCVLVNGLALVLSCIQDAESIAAGAWLAGWQAAREAGQQPPPLRVVQGHAEKGV